VKNLVLTAFGALTLTVAVIPVASVHAAPAPTTLEQVVHANVRRRDPWRQRAVPCV